MCVTSCSLPQIPARHSADEKPRGFVIAHLQHYIQAYQINKGCDECNLKHCFSCLQQDKMASLVYQLLSVTVVLGAVQLISGYSFRRQEVKIC